MVRYSNGPWVCPDPSSASFLAVSAQTVLVDGNELVDVEDLRNCFEADNSLFDDFGDCFLGDFGDCLLDVSGSGDLVVFVSIFTLATFLSSTSSEAFLLVPKKLR